MDAAALRCGVRECGGGGAASGGGGEHGGEEQGEGGGWMRDADREGSRGNTHLYVLCLFGVCVRLFHLETTSA